MIRSHGVLAPLVRTAVVLAGVSILAGCQSTAEAAPEPSSSPSSSANGRDEGGSMGDRGDSQTEQANLAAVLKLYTDAFPDPASSTAVATAGEVVAPDAVAHGSGQTAGPDGLLAEFTSDRERVPGAQAVVKRTAADGDLVAVHYQVASDPADERTGEAAVDLFRVQDGTVVERWSFDQPIATGTPASGNTNTMFSDLYDPPKPAVAPSESQEESDRVFAVNAYDTLFRDQDVSILDTAFDPAYLQHNPGRTQRHGRPQVVLLRVGRIPAAGVGDLPQRR
ncbi:ester cyclase [Rathayibacter tanaceti]|uniref:SnoaL-like polyketide cyclase n=1 Tax=Rathayibacter tanaceti TaxID=1671680 RepID=A0A166ICZ9_9MICO|nr:ester cyclase [Rathayibacter tanaceti]KZX22182.1 SnoaL-like polyketide cyclase [Rathayibacter tanaceti]